MGSFEEKDEIIKKMSQMIDDLKEKRKTIDANLREMLRSFHKNEFVTTDIMDLVKGSLLDMIELQKECSMQYEHIFPNETMPLSINKTVFNLEEMEKRLVISAEYETELHKFLALHHKDMEIDDLLSTHKKEIKLEELYSLTEEKCKKKYHKYRLFIQAVEMVDKLELMNSDLLNNIKDIFGLKLALEVLQKENKFYFSSEELKKTDADEEKETVVDTDSPVSVVSIPDRFEADDFKTASETFKNISNLIESKHQVMVDHVADSKEFGVKVFKSDIRGGQKDKNPFFNEQRLILNHLHKSNNYLSLNDLIKILQKLIEVELKEKFNPSVIEVSCNNLKKKGYLEEIILDGKERIFNLTEKALKALSSKEGAELIKVPLKKQREKEDLSEPIKAVVADMFSRAFTHSHLELEEDLKVKDIVVKSPLDSKGISFCHMARLIDGGKTAVYFTCLSDDEEIYKDCAAMLNGIDYVANKNENDFIIYVVGYNEEHIKAIVDILQKKLSNIQLASYDYSANSWLLIENEEVEQDENDQGGSLDKFETNDPIEKTATDEEPCLTEKIADEAIADKKDTITANIPSDSEGTDTSDSATSSSSDLESDNVSKETISNNEAENVTDGEMTSSSSSELENGITSEADPVQDALAGEVVAWNDELENKQDNVTTSLAGEPEDTIDNTEIYQSDDLEESIDVSSLGEESEDIIDGDDLSATDGSAGTIYGDSDQSDGREDVEDDDLVVDSDQEDDENNDDDDPDDDPDGGLPDLDDEQEEETENIDESILNDSHAISLEPGFTMEKPNPDLPNVLQEQPKNKNSILKEIEKDEAARKNASKLENDDLDIVLEDDNIYTDSKDLDFASVMSNVLKMIASDKIYCASAYLKAAELKNDSFSSLYNKLVYAVNDPLNKNIYASDTIGDIYVDANEYPIYVDYWMIASALRNYFNNYMAYDYSLDTLHNMLQQKSQLLSGEIMDEQLSRELNDLVYLLLTFKKDTRFGMDKYADYRSSNSKAWQNNLDEIKKTAQIYYHEYIESPVVEKGSNKRFIETQRMIFSKENAFGYFLETILGDPISDVKGLKELVEQEFIRDNASFNKDNIDDNKLSDYIDKYWNDAAKSIKDARKTSKLFGSFRNNLMNKMRKVMQVVCDYLSLMESTDILANDSGAIEYKKQRENVLVLLNKIETSLKTGFDSVDIDEKAGRNVLLKLVEELRDKLNGTYQLISSKYFYSGFLGNNLVALNDGYLPNIKDEMSDLRGVDIFYRILKHARGSVLSVDERIRKIIEPEEDNIDENLDIGSLSILLELSADMNLAEENIRALREYAFNRAKQKKEEFLSNLELYQSYGWNKIETEKDMIMRHISDWFDYCSQNHNFSLFHRIILAYNDKLQLEAKESETRLKKELDDYCANNDLTNPDIEHHVSRMQEMLEKQNYTVAEDILNRLNSADLKVNEIEERMDYLHDFASKYEFYYDKVKDSGRTLGKISPKLQGHKAARGGQRLIDNWIASGSSQSERRIKLLLEYLGFGKVEIETHRKISGKIENYYVKLEKMQNGQKNSKHSIPAFGSLASEKPFRIVCLYGKYDADSLLETFKDIGNTKHTLVLLDYALLVTEKRRLARKCKEDMYDKAFAVIDRVVLMYLADNYEETSISKKMMSLIMPFTYYQPYVFKSVDIMPPEIFIGREEELSKIESPTGANIVYGGRQLGKSALLRKAKSDINFNENGDRAVLVDLKDIDYKKAVKRIADALVDEKIFHRQVQVEDWEDLTREIKNRLNEEKDPIPYLLLLLDEADVFIESCSEINYEPFNLLKSIQNIGAERFKFVIAGLRNVVRFNKRSLDNNSILAHFGSITVKPFNYLDAKHLLELPLFYLGMRFPKEKESLVSTILANTNYFPCLIQLYCAKLIEAMKTDYAGYNENDTPPYMVSEDHIKKVLSEPSFRDDIREKFMITLKVDNDDNYYVIALLLAYLYHNDKGSEGGFLPEDIQSKAFAFQIKKIYDLSVDKIRALMEEMKELNILKNTAKDSYLFSRYNFFLMMGSKEEIDDKIVEYMEE